jgi:hypothetical protein
VTQSAIAISTTVRQCYVQLLYFGRIQDAESQDAWEKVREEFDELTSALSAERDSFTEEARVAVFLEPRHAYAARGRSRSPADSR